MLVNDAIPQEQNPFFEKPKAVKRTSWVVDVLQSIVIATFICIVIYLFIAIPNQVSGPSMMPNFHDGELLLTNKITQLFGGTPFGKGLGLDYKRGDVIVFLKPSPTGKDLIKRIVGMPGETVMVLNGDVYVNGNKITEEYISPEVRTNPGTLAQEGIVITVPKDSYFVIGDNRNNSIDSRFEEYGPIKREWMKGKVVLRYLPPQAFGIIGTGKIDLGT